MRDKRITFSDVELEHYPAWGFRPNTICVPIKMNFIFMNGGMGDMIAWLQPIMWLASEATWIHGTLIVPKYFRDIASYFLKPYPKWRFKDYTELHDLPLADNDLPFRGPVELHKESLNATGAHLSTCGWVYFTNKEKAPEGWDYYPQFKQEDLDQVEVPNMHGVNKYAVITTGTTTDSRRIKGEYWNPIIEHVRARGLTPVFLGKSVVETGNPANIHTKWDQQIQYELGIDLRDKTTLIQAAAIMSRAAVVVGHDNGLLHLAGCTAAPIVFGYNLASPEHREPKRPKGRTYNVVLTHKELACIHCQSNTNFLIGYNFRQCMYSDNKCMDILFENSAERWKAQIDLALQGDVDDATSD
jgi:hypothetical protein